MKSNEGCGRGGLVVQGGRDGEFNGGGVVLGVVKSCIGENPDEAIGEVDDDSRGVEGRSFERLVVLLVIVGFWHG
ncbi:hypothetical protein Tco_0348795 [Tanacetum coccineum]